MAMKDLRVGSLFERMDLFRRPLPSFNVKGRDTVPSCAGGCVSLAAMAVLLVYALMKLQDFLTRNSPTVTSYVDRYSIDSDEHLNLFDAGMRFAFGIEGYLDHGFRNSSNYVRSMARIYGYDNEGRKYEKILDYHLCEPKDFEQFRSPHISSQALYNKYFNGERHLYCLDWDEVKDELSIWGENANEENY